MHLRIERVNQLLKEEISKILIKGLKEPLGFLTITDVSIAPDLKEARVYFSVIGTIEERVNAKRILDENSGYISHQIGKKIQMKHTPHIKFFYDETPDRANKIFELLEIIKKEETSRQVSDDGKKEKRKRSNK